MASGSAKDILEDNPDPKYLCSEFFTTKVKKALHGNLDRIHGYRLTDYRGGNALHSWELDLKGACSADEIEFMNALLLNRRRSIFGTHKDGKSLTKEQILTFYNANKFSTVTELLIEKGYLQITHEGYKPVCGNMSFEVFKFLDPNSVSITLTASDSNRLGIYHNGQLRRVTPRECARLQGYPDSYKLINDQAVYKQMGNGVSVPVVKAVALDFFKSNSIFK
ncbi:DNA cytosine methyltransferase [Acinetobacter sp. ULE_I057]|uniref:DNA cytosine methyltransferase n=1 Tax=Acinetobacter sp. ULE_I057 TaxID=3373070 RepID=UPI003AF75E70